MEERYEHRCDCGGQMVKCDVDFESMTEGQMADHLAGFSRPFVCESCQGLTLRDIDIHDADSREHTT